MDRPTLPIYLPAAAIAWFLLNLACGAGSGDGDEPVAETTLEEQCERHCASPTERDDPNDTHPCAGEPTPASCVSDCIAAVEAATGGDVATCQDCVLRSGGWQGQRVVRNTSDTFGFKTSCETTFFRGTTTSGHTAVDFSRCEPLEICDGVAFETPADGTWCGPKCGFALVASDDPDASTADAH